MPKASDLITEVIQMMHGFGQTQDRQAVLTNAIGATDTSFTVDAAYGVSVGISPGIVEIDSEQLYVTAVDQSTNICTLANGFGRGYAGTTAAAHAQYSRIVSQPKFPRATVFQQMNEVIGGLFPDLFGVQTFTTTVTYPQYTYTLPSRPIRILTVQWQDPLQQWHRVFAHSVDEFDGSVKIGSGAYVGRPLRFIYATEPVQFVSESDDFATQTLLPASASDVLVLGTAQKLAVTFDLSRAQVNNVEQQARSTSVPPNTGINIGTYLNKQYTTRLNNEAQSLQRKYPARMRGTVN